MTSYRIGVDGIPEIEKAPGGQLDYSLDWTGWLAPNELIASVDWDAPDGLTIMSRSNDGKIVTVWLDGGAKGQNYVVSATITTDQTPPRIDTRSLRLLCRTR